MLAHYNQDHGKPEELVRDARATVDRIKTFIADNDILRLPDPDRCKIVEMPEFRRGFSVAYLDPAPPLDPKASSNYAISPPPSGWDDRRVNSYLEEYNKYMIQILTIHEAYPGHYVQLEYSNRCPSLIPARAVFGRLRGGLGRLYRADDARPGLRQGRSGDAVEPAQMVFAGRGQCLSSTTTCTVTA